jgi:hypothetical protein
MRVCRGNAVHAASAHPILSVFLVAQQHVNTGNRAQM